MKFLRPDSFYPEIGKLFAKGYCKPWAAMVGSQVCWVGMANKCRKILNEIPNWAAMGTVELVRSNEIAEVPLNSGDSYLTGDEIKTILGE